MKNPESLVIAASRRLGIPIWRCGSGWLIPLAAARRIVESKELADVPILGMEVFRKTGRRRIPGAIADFSDLMRNGTGDPAASRAEAFLFLDSLGDQVTDSSLWVEVTVAAPGPEPPE